MERDHRTHHDHQNPKETSFTDSPRNHNNITTNDRSKRDEWSEGAVSTLLDAYETKWTLRNRAKLKGHDWEDVAKRVSCRGNGSKSAKTQTQCKNKIESMKKRYRSESVAGEAAPSSWPLYPRLDMLLRGSGVPCPGVGAVAAPVVVVESVAPAVVLPAVQAAVEEVPVAVVEMGCGEEKLRGVSDGGRLAKEEGDGINNGKKLSINQEQPEKKNPVILDETADSISTPAICIQRDDKSNTKVPLKRKEKSKKRRSTTSRDDDDGYNWDIGDSIRWLAEVVLRSEQTRMETMREIERMRAEVEAKRSEMDLKRTQIIANTQLQIAKLFAKGSTIQDWNKMT